LLPGDGLIGLKELSLFAKAAEKKNFLEIKPISFSAKLEMFLHFVPLLVTEFSKPHVPFPDQTVLRSPFEQPPAFPLFSIFKSDPIFQ